MQIEAGEEAIDAAVNGAQTVLQDPLYLAVAILGVFGLLAAGYLFQQLRKKPGDRMAAALARTDEVAILMHPNPDPDAMASAVGLAVLADSVDTDATLYYPGQIRHPENRAFETVLGLSLERVEGLADIGPETIVLVDHNEPRGFAGADRIEPYAVVDHHPGTGTGERFTDVRPGLGACSTIVAEYLKDRGWTVDGDGKRLGTDTATGLLYGIQSDTTSFSRGCTLAEFDAAAYLYPATDPDALDRIANPQLDTETLEVKARAIRNREIQGSFLVSHVDEVSNVDALPQAAEELVRLEGVTAAVVTGIHDGDLHLSGRSRDDRVHMGKALEAAMESVPDATAGGHARMGGGRAALLEAGDGSQEVLTQRLFTAMNGGL